MRFAAPEARPVAVYPILAAGLACFAVSPILVRLANEAPGLAIATWRTAIAVAMLTPFALPRIGAEVRAFARRDWALIGVAGVLLGLHFVTWIESLYHTSVASASVLVSTSPIFIAVLGFVFLRERLARRVVVALVLAVAGAAFIGWGDVGSTVGGGRPLLGNSLALGAALVVSVYMLIGRVVRQGTSWMAYVYPLYVVVALTVAVLALGRGVPLWGFSAGFYGLCALMALGPQLLGHGSFNYALRYFPAALLGLLSLIEPVGASVIAFFLFGEVPGPLAFAGMALVLGSVTLALWPAQGLRRRAPAR